MMSDTINPPFPIAELEDAYRKRVRNLSCSKDSDYNDMKYTHPISLIGFCHWHRDGEFDLWAGFQDALEKLQSSSAKREIPLPMLIFGLHSLEQLKKFPDETKVLKWPGVQYLRYDADDATLAKAVQRCLQGSTEPVPDCLFVTVGDITLLSSEVRHWLENRLRNTNGALHDFEAAKRGEIRLHPNHLEPVPAISNEHQATLERFCSLEPHVLRLAPEASGLRKFSVAIGNFQSHWQALETAKKALRNAPSAEHSGPAVSQMIEAQERSRDALETAIAATRDLDNELTGVSSETS